MRPQALTQLWREGRLLRLKAGLWQLADALPEEHADLVQAALAVPQGVICLLSALDFHGLTDANPEQVFVAIVRQSWAPRVVEVPVHFVRLRPRLFHLGIEEHAIGGHPVRVYSPEKTLCDCLRLPELVGKDLFLVALRRYLCSPGARPGALLALARECRVLPRMQPYVEALVA